jgi:hypothetical protein
VTSVRYYRDLLLQEARIEAFRRAIAAQVRPGDTVLEIGTGLGTFAFFAADAGASRVWAVDGDPIVHVARAIARHNGYGDRVAFVRGWLPEVRLPERADVIVLEDFSPRLLDGRLVPLLRLLARDYAVPHARFVPAAAHFRMAPVSSTEVWTAATSFGGEETRYGIDWSASREYVTNAPHAIEISPEAVIAQPAVLGTVSLGDPSTHASEGRATWTFDRDRLVHGLAYWFDLELSAAERLSNAPGARPGSWGHLFLPIDPPLSMSRGQDLHALVGARKDLDGVPGSLCWTVRAGEQVRRGHEFTSRPASVHDLLAGSPDYVPALGARARRESRALALVDGHRSIRDIAAALDAAGDIRDLAGAERYVAGILRDRIERRANGAGAETQQ